VLSLSLSDARAGYARLRIVWIWSASLLHATAMSISIALERVRRCVRLPQKLWRFPAATRQLRSLLASPVAQMPRLAKIDSCPRWTPHRIAKRRIDKAARRDDGRTAIESRRQFWRAPLATLVPQCSTRAVQRRLLHVPLSFGANASCSRQRGVFLPSSMDTGYGYRPRGTCRVDPQVGQQRDRLPER